MITGVGLIGILHELHEKIFMIKHSETDFPFVKVIYKKIARDDFPLNSFDQLPTPD